MLKWGGGGIHPSAGCGLESERWYVFSLVRELPLDIEPGPYRIFFPLVMSGYVTLLMPFAEITTCWPNCGCLDTQRLNPLLRASQRSWAAQHFRSEPASPHKKLSGALGVARALGGDTAAVAICVLPPPHLPRGPLRNANRLGQRQGLGAWASIPYCLSVSSVWCLQAAWTGKLLPSWDSAS